ncbi:MAG: NUMOD3 domain-containing DNA-binding protein [Candidatus Dormibacteria bacterium]
MRKGHQHSDISKAKIGAKNAIRNLGHVVSPATRLRISNTMKGRKSSPEELIRLRTLRLGVIVSTATREKMSKAHKGKSPTQKVIAAREAYWLERRAAKTATLALKTNETLEIENPGNSTA